MSYSGKTLTIWGNTIINQGLTVNNNIIGTLGTAYQPNITSLGTLSNLTVNDTIKLNNGANINSNININGNMNMFGSLYISNGKIDMACDIDVVGNIHLSSGFIYGNLGTFTQANITTIGALTGLNILGNSNISGDLKVYGNATIYGNTNINGNLIIQSGQLIGTLGTVAQPNITSIGVLTELNVSGFTSLTGNLLTSGNIITGNINVINTTVTKDLIVSGNVSLPINSVSFINSFGSFANTTTQTTGVNSITLITFDTILFNSGITCDTILTKSKIIFSYSGYYNLNFIIQANNTQTGNKTDNLTVWITQNGNAIVNSATILELATPSGTLGAYTLSRTFIINANANDFIQIYWTADLGYINLKSYPSGIGVVHPGSPSILLNITRISS